MSEANLSTFIRDITRRSERVTNNLLDGFRQYTAQTTAELRLLQAETAQSTRVLVRVEGVLADLQAESQAQRGAILRVLDELRRDDDR